MLRVHWVLTVLVLKVLMVLVVLCASLTLQAQTPAAPRDGVISGQVVDAATGRPVGAVVVSISGPGISTNLVPTRSTGAVSVAANPSVPRILTGADGRFMFRDLGSGGFTVTASKGGYADGASGRRRPGGAPQALTLTDVQRSHTAVIRVWKNAAIAGTVLDEAGEPVVGLAVLAMARTLVGGRRRFGHAGATAITDDRGMYRIGNVQPGEYLVMASPPLMSARVSTLLEARASGRGGAGELAALATGALLSGTMGLQVGDAMIGIGRGQATPPPPAGARMQVYPPTFHPAANSPAQAVTIVVASGEERTGVDLQLQPVAAARVSGTVSTPAGPAALATLHLVPEGFDEVDPWAFAPLAGADAGGTFTFPAVTPGQYRLQTTVRPTPSGTNNDVFWTDMPMTIAGADVDGVVVSTHPGLRLAGRFEFEGTNPRPTGPPQRPTLTVPISLERADGPAPVPRGGTSSSQDGFALTGIPGGRYRVRVSNSPAGWMFKSATLNGVDVSETPFDFSRDVSDLVITFTDRWTGVSGVVQGTGADAAVVLVFPTDAQAWTDYGTTSRRLKSARPNAQGRFGLSSLPPGDYFIVAIPDEQSADWIDPKTLDALARLATQISIGDGDHRTIDLRVREVKP